MRLVGHGHAAIRATHHKTLEFTSDGDITERATCVVAVGVRGAAQPLAGDVRITIGAGSESFAFDARANSSWEPGGAAVIRRSPQRLPGTFATHASAAASDLPPSLVAAIREPAAEVTIDVEPVRGRACAVLFALDAGRPTDARLAAELAAAELVVAEDEDAARALGVRVATGPVALIGRVLVVAARELPGASVAAELENVGVETVGLTPSLAAAAASPSRAPLVVSAGDPRAALRDAPASSRVVVAASAGQIDGLLAFATEHRGTGAAVLVQPYAPPVRLRAGEPIELPSRKPGYLCFDPVGASTALDPRVRAAVGVLLADGVSTRTAANVLAELTGMPRRRAYDLVLGWPDR